MTEPLVLAAGARYRVGDAVLVDGIDLSVLPGEMVGVIGPNGAGKTTLLRLLAGDLRCTEGRVALGADRVRDLSPEQLATRRAVFGQQAAADVPFTVRTVVEFGRHPHRRDPGNSAARDRAVVAEALRLTDTAHLADRVFATLSGGERTRVTLARVLAQDAPLVLLDEPTTSLDVGHEELVMGVLRHLAGRGHGVVAVLHDLNAASFYADRLLLLDRGRVRAEGGAGEVLRDDVLSEVYRHPLRVLPHPFRGCPMVVTADRPPAGPGEPPG